MNKEQRDQRKKTLGSLAALLVLIAAVLQLGAWGLGDTGWGVLSHWAGGLSIGAAIVFGIWLLYAEVSDQARLSKQQNGEDAPR